jgi:hypothetical protein
LRRIAVITGIVIAAVTMSTIGAGPAQARTGDTTPYKKAYPTFTSFTRSGSGPRVFPLPAAATTGILIAKSSGSEYSEFSIETLDKGNHRNFDGDVYESGSYAGTTAYGLSTTDTPTRAIRVSASAHWTITIKQVSRAPFLTKTGRGDHVFLYGGKAKTLRVTTRSDDYFAIDQTQLDQDYRYPEGIINEFGPFSGTAAFLRGPSVIEVDADGAWSIK